MDNRLKSYMKDNRLKDVKVVNNEVDFVGLELDNLHLVVNKNTNLGIYNGYVGVKKGHRYYGVYYEDVKLKEQVHGGLTYSGYMKYEGFKSDYWYLGFDTAHLGDYVPNMPVSTEEFIDIVFNELPKGFKEHLRNMMNVEEEFRDVTYVIKEVIKLAKQLKEGV